MAGSFCLGKSQGSNCGQDGHMLTYMRGNAAQHRALPDHDDQLLSVCASERFVLRALGIKIFNLFLNWEKNIVSAIL